MKILNYLTPLILLTSTSGLPVKYDQRQDGDLNVHAHLENFIIVFVPTGALMSTGSLLDFLPLKKQNTLIVKPENNGAPSEEKFVPQGTGTKVSAPDFPAGNSPYKVDIDKSGGEKTEEKEVLIAHIPQGVLSSFQIKSEGEPVDTTTLAPSDEESTTKLVVISPPAAGTANSDKKENSGQKTQIKEEETEVKEEKKDDKKTEAKEEIKDDKTEVKEEIKDDKTEVKEEMKDDKKTEVKEEIKDDKKTEIKEEKKDDAKPAVKDEKKTGEEVKVDVPDIDSTQGKLSKAPKSIGFGIEAAKPRLQSVEEDESPSAVYSTGMKIFKFPTHRQEVDMDPPVGSEEYTMRLKALRTGVHGCEPGEEMMDNGQCLPTNFKQRNANYVTVEKLLPILQFGVSAANVEQSD